MSKLNIAPLFNTIADNLKGLGALALDIATSPFRSSAELYKALRSGYDIFGVDMKDPSYVPPPIRKQVNEGNSPVVAFAITASMATLESSVGAGIGYLVPTLLGQRPEVIVASVIVAGLANKTLCNALSEAMGTKYAGTGAPTMPYTAALKLERIKKEVFSLDR